MKSLIIIMFLFLPLFTGCDSRRERIEVQEKPNRTYKYLKDNKVINDFRAFMGKTASKYGFHLIEPKNPIIVNNSEKFIIALRSSSQEGAYCLTVDNVISDNEMVVMIYEDNCIDDLALNALESELIQYLEVQMN